MIRLPIQYVIGTWRQSFGASQVKGSVRCFTDRSDTLADRPSDGLHRCWKPKSKLKLSAAVLMLYVRISHFCNRYSLHLFWKTSVSEGRTHIIWSHFMKGKDLNWSCSHWHFMCLIFPFSPLDSLSLPIISVKILVLPWNQPNRAKIALGKLI